jgi:hypothetical protein
VRKKETREVKKGQQEGKSEVVIERYIRRATMKMGGRISKLKEKTNE